MKIKLYLISIWSLLDPIYYLVTRLTYIGKTPETNIFRVRFINYKGKALTLSDGTNIQKNDTLLRIHLHNVRLLKELSRNDSDVKRALYIYRSVENSLPDLVKFLEKHSQFQQIKGIIGITMLNRGSDRLGFERITISSRWYKAFKWISLLPIYCLSVSPLSLEKIKKHEPRYLFMSKDTLLHRYTKA